MQESVQKGYLDSINRYVHIKDKNSTEFESHHHDFCKIVIFISGKVDYIIEGKTYSLRPWDILLVNQFQIHQPIIDPSIAYERIVIWMNPVGIEKFSTEEFSVLSLFQELNKMGNSLIRLPITETEKVRGLLNQIEENINHDHITKNVMTNLYIVQLLVFLFQIYDACAGEISRNDVKFDKSILAVMDYIQENIHEELSVETIARAFFASKHHLMRKFKLQTGMTMHKYILHKRLLVAKQLILNGHHMTEVCLQSGFSDYTTFYRTFKKEYQMSPRAYAQQHTHFSVFRKTVDES